MTFLSSPSSSRNSSSSSSSFVTTTTTTTTTPPPPPPPSSLASPPSPATKKLPPPPLPSTKPKHGVVSAVAVASSSSLLLGEEDSIRVSHEDTPAPRFDGGSGGSSSSSTLGNNTSCPTASKSPLYISSTDHPLPSLEATLTLDNKVYLLYHNAQWIEGIFTVWEYGLQFQAFHVMMGAPAANNNNNKRALHSPEPHQASSTSKQSSTSEEDHLLNFYLPFTMIHTVTKVQRGTGGNGTTSGGTPSSASTSHSSLSQQQQQQGSSTVGALEHHPSQNAIELQLLTKHLRRIVFSMSMDKSTADIAVQAIVQAKRGAKRIRATIFHKNGNEDMRRMSGVSTKRMRRDAVFGRGPNEERQEKVESPRNSPSPQQIDGWTLYDPLTEYTRQGVLTSPNKEWRLTNVNSKFTHIESYPEVFCVPNNLTDDQIINGLKKRSKGRIPVLAWWDKKTGVSLSRSAQPKRGLNLKRKKFKKDIVMLEAFLSTNPQSKRMTIVDLRPKLNAQANRIKGAGFEDISKFPFSCDLKFMNIGNIHVMRESFHHVARLVLDTHGDSEKWLSALDSTKWLNHTQLILKAGWCVVELMLVKKHTVLVHCSDGWDRTSQVLCVAELLMDPYYRTLEGFCVLIQKDFITYGHMFEKRIGHEAYNPKDSDLSPIFFQFLETVHNLMCQFPGAFEFNEYFLIRIMDEVYSCKYGTFLGNSERDRHVRKVVESTQSLWSHLLHPDNVGEFQNPLYKLSDRVLRPDFRMCSIRLWTNYWLRWTKLTNMHFSNRFELSETLAVQQCATGSDTEDTNTESSVADANGRETST